MSKKLFFVDDSGSRTWGTPYTRDFIVSPPDRNSEYIEYWRRNYFVLAGIHISSEKINNIAAAIESEKQKYFKTKDVEIKSHWLRIPEKRNIHYLRKYPIPMRSCGTLLRIFGTNSSDRNTSRHKRLCWISDFLKKEIPQLLRWSPDICSIICLNERTPSVRSFLIR